MTTSRFGDAGRGPEETKRIIRDLEAERTRLERRASELEQEITRQRADQDRIHKQVTGFQAESRRFSQQLVLVTQQNSRLASLYTATHCLQMAADRGEVLAATREIVANLIGSEDMGIYEVAPGGEALALASHLGSTALAEPTIPIGEGLIGRAVLQPEPMVYSREVFADGVLATIPLRVGRRPIGVIAIFGLLPHKPRLEPIDSELFRLLATHAAAALHRARSVEAAEMRPH